MVSALSLASKRLANTLSATVLMIAFVLLSSSFAGAVNLYTYTNAGTSGAWNDPATWTTDPTGATSTGSAVPGANDVVTILNGFTVFLTANVSTSGLVIVLNNGGTLDLATNTFNTINSLSGSGTIRIQSGYFPAVTNNSFVNSAAAGATVSYYDFTGAIPTTINYPNLAFSNGTSADHTISFANTSGATFTVFGNLTTTATGTGDLIVRLGTQAGNALTLTANGNIAVGTGTTLGAGIVNSIHTLNVEGNMVNNGVVRFSNSAQYTASGNGAVRLFFTGAADRTLSCQGPTNLYTLTINKGTGSVNVLSVTSTNVANLSLYSNSQLITITQGTLRLGANINIPRIFGGSPSNWDLGSPGQSPMLWIDGADFNTNGAALVAYGKFRITAGSFTTLGGQGCVIREEGQYIIEGGTFTTEKFRPSSTALTHRGTFTMTGGVFNAIGTGSSDGAYARFSLPYPEQVFIMSGGTINIRNSQTATGSLHIGCDEANYNVTGGTINVILSGTAASFPLLSTAPLWDLIISRQAGATATVVTLANIGNRPGSTFTAKPLVVQNDLVIEGVNAARLTANDLDVTVGGDFIIESGATYTPGSNTTTFNGTADQAFELNGTITSGLNNLSVSKSAGTLTLTGSSSSLVVGGTLSLLNGIVNDGGKTIEARTNVQNDAVHTGTGSITLNGSAAQMISGDGTGVFGNLILNNNSVPGASLISDATVSGTLTLAGGGNSLFDIGPYQLWLSSTSPTALTTTGAGFSATKMIRTLGLQSDRGVKKSFGNLAPFTFHFGAGTDYTPATTQLAAAPAAYGAIGARPVHARNPFVTASNTRNLTCYWKIVNEGFSGVVPGSVTHQFTYLPSHVVPAGDDVSYIPARYNAGGWTVINDITPVDEGTRSVHFAAVDYLEGDFTAGVPAAFSSVQSYYTIRDGLWNDNNPATTPWSTVSHTGPPASTIPGANDQVFIGDGATNNHTITTGSNGQTAGSLSIAVGSTLDIATTTGHNFGFVSSGGASSGGLLRISSSTPTAQFPVGDFGLFIRAAGGSVEYYTTASQSFTIPTASIAPTNLPLISYRNLILTPQGGSAITLPDLNMTVFGNMTVQGLASNGMVELNSAASRTLGIAGHLVISEGNLQFMNQTAQTVSIAGNVTIGASGTWSMSTSGTASTNELIISGNIINNGTLDFSVTGNRVCNTTFTGAANTSVTGTGVLTDFNIIRVVKGVNQSSVLNINATAFSLSGGNRPLIMERGTFRLSSGQTVVISNNEIFTIPAETRLSANGGTLSLAGGNGIDMRVVGTLEVLGGTVNIGTASNDNSLEYAATGMPVVTVSGGTLNINSQIRRSTASTQGALTYNQSGSSVVTVGRTAALSTTRGVFEILNAGSSFNMSGGTLRIGRGASGSAIADLYLHPTSSAVSGGTIEVGSTASSHVISVNTGIPLFSLSAAGSSNGVLLESNPLTLRGSLTINDNNYFDANGLSVSIAGDLVNANTSASTLLTGGGYRPRTISQTTTFNGSLANQTITGASGNLTLFANLVINNSLTGGSVSLQSNSAVRVAGTLTLTRGILADGGNTITAMANVLNSATHTSTGSGHLALAGASNQVIGGNGTGKFGNVILNNSSGASFAANQEITGGLTFTSGLLFINQYGLYLSNTSLSAISGATSTRYIVTSGQLSNGGVRKAFESLVTNGSFVYPVGVAGKYTPASYTITTGALGGTITVKPVNSKHPSATGSGSSFVNYYWNVTNSVISISSLTHAYQYVAVDERGTPAEYRDAHFETGAWNIGNAAGNPDPVARIITFTNTNVAGDYTAGEPTAFVNPTVYISIASGDWESDDAVWDQDPPGTNLGPPAGSFVIISEGHTITINTNNKLPATLDVRGSLHLGTTTGHDFGTVSATGLGARTIQIQSSIFPSGNFSSFVAANGGTVEYNGALTLPTQSTYNHIVFSGSGTKIMPSADLTINGSMSILSGTVNNAVYNRSIVLVSGTDDFTNHGVFNAGSGVLIVERNLINTGASAILTTPGGGIFGMRVGGNLSNTGGATYIGGSDQVTIEGSLVNEGSFSAGSGELTVDGGVGTSGSFVTGSGTVAIGGSLTNHDTFTAGTGPITTGGDLINTGTTALYSANANTLTVNGALQNMAGATFNAGSGSVTARGDWINQGFFNGGTGRVLFTAPVSQSLTGATSFYNVTKSAGGMLTLNSTITIENTLTLVSGRIVTGSNTVALTNTLIQPVTGQSAGSFIDGKLSVSYPNTAGTGRIFPVGKGTVYRPVVIYQNVASLNPVVRAEMVNTPPSGSYPVTIQGLSEARYFSIDLLSGTMNSPVVELSFNTNGPADENIAIAGNARVVRATAPTGPWTDEGGSGVFSPSAPAGYATSDVTSIANPTYFALAYQNVPLPITLARFTATAEEEGVLLKWTTLGEKNNAYFTIERSVGGLAYDSILSLPGAGDSYETIHYSTLDQYPLFGVSYYRLRQTDYDGKFSTSRVVRVENLEKRSRVDIYPNPSDEHDEVFLYVRRLADIRGRVVIASVTGRVYFDDIVDLPGPFNITAALGALPGRGIYIVSVTGAGVSETGKLLIR